MPTRTLISLLVTLAGALLLAGPAAAQNMAHVHMGHVTKSWKDTPGEVGLLDITAQEAEIAHQHAGFSTEQLKNLDWMKLHVRHVRHAIDPGTESGGPGKGYGVLKGARGVEAHIGFAADAEQATGNVKTHAEHVGTCARNIQNWAQEVLSESEQVLSADSASAAVPHVRRIRELTGFILNGQDNSWQNGGVKQARQHMGFMEKGEGMG